MFYLAIVLLVAASTGSELVVHYYKFLLEVVLIAVAVVLLVVAFNTGSELVVNY